MTQVVLPNTIDAGTEIVASEHQQNYELLRDVINGQLEGGSGSSGNIKANGITPRELADAILLKGVPGASGSLQEGVYGSGDLKVTPGAGLNLSYASGTAWITDDSGLLALNALLPATIAGASVVVGSNASGNPRIDQIIATLTDFNAATVSVLAGTASVGAGLDNRAGAAALPVGAIRLADILVPNGFAGPFVQNTHIRDRRPWARGVNFRTADTGGDVSLAGMATVGSSYRVETSGGLLEVSIFGSAFRASGTPDLVTRLVMDGATVLGSDGTTTLQHAMTTSRTKFEHRTEFVPTAGSHLFAFQAQETAADLTLSRSTDFPLTYVIRERVVQNSDNSGA